MKRRALALLITGTTGCFALTDLGGFVGPAASSDGGPDVISTSETGTDGAPNNNVTLPPPTKWTRIEPTTGASPPDRHSGRMVYDSKRDRVILFGGNHAEGGLNDTWEWDGATWTERNDTPAPSPRQGFGFAYDADRGVTVLFGGQGGVDIWELDANGWKARPANNLPGRLAGFSATYDPVRKLLVGFGGHDEQRSLGDFWTWNGTTAIRSARSSTEPPAMRGHRLVYDEARQQIVLFGGIPAADNNSFVEELWLFDGTKWSAPPITGAGPSARASQCMAYDRDRKLIVLFGGKDAPNVLADTWLWDGKSWTPGPSGPRARRSCAMAYDAGRKKIVMFGGARNNERGALDDFWALD